MGSTECIGHLLMSLDIYYESSVARNPTHKGDQEGQAAMPLDEENSFINDDDK